MDLLLRASPSLRRRSSLGTDRELQESTKNRKKPMASLSVIETKDRSGSEGHEELRRLTVFPRWRKQTLNSSPSRSPTPSLSPQGEDEDCSTVFYHYEEDEEEDEEEEGGGGESRQALKQLSASAPAMPLRSSPARSDSELMLPSSSKSRQKKFHRHFKQLPPNETVLDYYSCALVGDILLQGYLYITENHFAFYSNVFGYITKILIPVHAILKITKEKTAKIIPNAVGIFTKDDKHVFGSLLSRDSTYKLMVRVWKHSTDQLAEEKAQEDQLRAKAAAEEVLFGEAIPVEDVDSSESVSGNDSALEHSCSPTPGDTPTEDNCDGVTNGGSHVRACFKKLNGAVSLKRLQIGIKRNYVRLSSLPVTPSSLLLFSTCLLVLLFVSASVLLVRINTIQQELERRAQLTDSDFIYQELARLQTHLHSTSANEFQRFLNANVGQIAKVRQSLEALSLLFVTRPEENESAAAAPSEDRDS